MKRLALLFSLLAAFPLALAACGGGGGGAHGGSGSPSAAVTGFISKASGGLTPKSTAEAPKPTTQQAAVEALLPTALQQEAIDNGGELFKIDNTHTAIACNGSDPECPVGGVSLNPKFKPGDMEFYQHNGVDFAVLKTDPKDIDSKSQDWPNWVSQSFEGTVSSAYILWAGKLDHSVFGYWAQIVAMEGSETDPMDNKKYQKSLLVANIPEAGDTFFYGNASKEAKYADGLTGEFKGVATGFVQYDNDDYNAARIFTDTKALLGTATLNLGGKTLVLDFPTFYKLTADVNFTSGQSGITGGFTGWEKGASYEKWHADLPDFNAPGWTQLFELDGKFYGASENNPSEAAGKWLLGTYDETDESYQSFRMHGAFGVKAPKQ